MSRVTCNKGRKSYTTHISMQCNGSTSTGWHYTSHCNWNSSNNDYGQSDTRSSYVTPMQEYSTTTCVDTDATFAEHQNNERTPSPSHVKRFWGFSRARPANLPCNVFAESEHVQVLFDRAKTNHQQKPLECSTWGGIQPTVCEVALHNCVNFKVHPHKGTHSGYVRHDILPAQLPTQSLQKQLFPQPCRKVLCRCGAGEET